MTLDGDDGEGRIMTKDNSVSICADRALRFVEPNRVSVGELSAVGESQMPLDEQACQ